MCQINWWLRVSDRSGNAMAFHRELEPRRCATFREAPLSEWNVTSPAKTRAKFIKEGYEEAARPKAEEPVEMDPQIA